jgi:hypothetical protein
MKRRLEVAFNGPQQSADGNVEKFLIHPDLARNAKVEWPDVDLDE